MTTFNFCKRIIPLILIGCFFGFTAIGQSQNIKFRIHSPFTLELGYEHLLNQKQSLALSFQATAYTKDQLLSTDFSKFPSGESYKLNLEHRVYFDQEKTLNGFYFGQHISYGTSTASASKFIGTSTVVFLFDEITIQNYAKGELGAQVIGLGISTGYQKRWKNFNLDLGTSLTYNTPLTKEPGITLNNKEVVAFPNHMKGFQPTFFVGLGVAF